MYDLSYIKQVYITLNGISITMKEKTSLLGFGIIILAAGDFFYFVSILFQSFMIEFITSMSSEIISTGMNQSSERVLLLLISIIGTLMYFIGLIFIGLSREDRENQKRIILLALITWFITDSIASFIFGFNLMILFNTVFLLTGIIFYKLTDFE